MDPGKSWNGGVVLTCPRPDFTHGKDLPQPYRPTDPRLSDAEESNEAKETLGAPADKIVRHPSPMAKA